jgi:hypothetical protein
MRCKKKFGQTTDTIFSWVSSFRFQRSRTRDTEPDTRTILTSNSKNIYYKYRNSTLLALFQYSFLSSLATTISSQLLLPIVTESCSFFAIAPPAALWHCLLWTISHTWSLLGLPGTSGPFHLNWHGYISTNVTANDNAAAGVVEDLTSWPVYFLLGVFALKLPLHSIRTLVVLVLTRGSFQPPGVAELLVVENYFSTWTPVDGDIAYSERANSFNV